LKDWKIGKLENWKKLEDWKVERWEGGKVERLKS
jgi:hypothetical protein